MGKAMQQVDVLRAACCVAAADGRIGSRERQVLEHLAELAGVGAASFKAMCEMAVNDKSWHTQQLKYVRDYGESAMTALAAVAAADGVITDEEREMLNNFASKLELESEVAEEAMRKGFAKVGLKA
ncbi:MAG: TerB family tellurite resistance protein [Planctomycetota bacterium]